MHQNGPHPDLILFELRGSNVPGEGRQGTNLSAEYAEGFLARAGPSDLGSGTGDGLMVDEEFLLIAGVPNESSAVL